MRDEYDFSNAKPNPYARKLKTSVTIRLEPEIIRYFKQLATESGIPYQTLINLFLLDCARKQVKPNVHWAS
jgi:predicted DNA binding CopG/RHH family protein